MRKRRYLLLILALAAGYTQARPSHTPTTYNALPGNEKLCMKAVSKLLAKQHVLFGDTNSSPDIRRAAERAIDATREAFDKKQSYCDAQNALQAFAADPEQGFRSNPGEINKFIHSSNEGSDSLL